MVLGDVSSGDPAGRWPELCAERLALRSPPVPCGPDHTSPHGTVWQPLYGDLFGRLRGRPKSRRSRILFRALGVDPAFASA
ncbi:hypothetical protein GCM10009789_35730 [Kribbella sancticallisti]|uniref:Uncharacterized protein n=1 Tax=Kribbella sancticallisti TaxID=460087 RepID=A0ABN2DK11_9ACTN